MDSSLQLVAVDANSTTVDANSTTDNGIERDPSVDYDDSLTYASNGVQELNASIKQDDSVEMIRVLKTMDLILLNELLHKNEEVVDKQFGVWHCDDILKHLQCTRPLFLCVIYQSVDCLRILLKTGKVNIHIQDRRGNNIIHLLSYLSKVKPSDKIADMYQIVLEEVTGKLHRRRLLSHRSFDGLNPLELASKLQISTIFKAIVTTDGAYRETLSEQGVVIRNAFSFPTSPSGWSFLWQLTWADSDARSTKNGHECLNLPVVKYFIQKKFKKWLPLIVFWFLLRCVYIMLYIALSVVASDLYDRHVCFTNQTLKNSDTFPNWFVKYGTNQMSALTTAIVVYSAMFCYVTMCVDIVEIIYIWKTLKITRQFFRVNIPKTFIVNSNFYRVVSFVAALTICIHLHSALLPILSGNVDSFTLLLSSILYLILMTLMVLNIIYFLQLLEIYSIGSFFIGFQKIIIELVRFALLQMLVWLSFSAFQTYIRQFLCKPSNLTCAWDSNSFYNTFVTTFDSQTIIPKNGDCIGPGETMLKIIHVMYFLIAVVLTISYFIAIVNGKYASSSDQATNSVSLHRLHIALVIERRVDMLRILVNKIKPGTWKAKNEEMIVVWEFERN